MVSLIFSPPLAGGGEGERNPPIRNISSWIDTADLGLDRTQRFVNALLGRDTSR